ncbi:MAG: zinc metalloprotease HtpX [Candidatus Sedimenticola endophacoides]
MDRQTTSRHKFRNLGHTLLLLGVMSLLLAFCSRLLLGGELWGWLFFTAGLAILGLPDIPSRWVLRLYNARPLLPSAAPALSGLTRELVRRAGLERVPVLYWIPSRTVNAFSVGSRDDAALALTDGLLRLLSPRELAGVLAHEISHVSNNDMRLMGLADMISRLTHLMSVLGLLLMLLSLPLMMFGMAMFPLSGMLLLLAAPGISALLQLGLSRVREFDADLEAARITGDPRGLASALARIEQGQGGLWRRILMPGYREPLPSLLRTHPDTRERIGRLLEMSGGREGEWLFSGPYPGGAMWSEGVPVVRRPRHRILFGIWH